MFQEISYGIDFRLGLIAYFLSWFCSKDNGRWTPLLPRRPTPQAAMG